MHVTNMCPSLSHPRLAFRPPGSASRYPTAQSQGQRGPSQLALCRNQPRFSIPVCRHLIRQQQQRFRWRHCPSPTSGRHQRRYQRRLRRRRWPLDRRALWELYIAFLPTDLRPRPHVLQSSRSVRPTDGPEPETKPVGWVSGSERSECRPGQVRVSGQESRRCEGWYDRGDQRGSRGERVPPLLLLFSLGSLLTMKVLLKGDAEETEERRRAQCGQEEGGGSGGGGLRCPVLRVEPPAPSAPAFTHLLFFLFRFFIYIPVLLNFGGWGRGKRRGRGARRARLRIVIDLGE
jgi:hypothetical protein